MVKIFPLIFVLLWSSAFITTKPIINNSDPFTALALRFFFVGLGFLCDYWSVLITLILFTVGSYFFGLFHYACSVVTDLFFIKLTSISSDSEIELVLFNFIWSLFVTSCNY